MADTTPEDRVAVLADAEAAAKELVRVATETLAFVAPLVADTFTPDQRQELSNRRDALETAFEAASAAIRKVVFTW